MGKFVTPRDIQFMQNLNRELVDRVIETLVTIYKLNILNSPTNIYGEAQKKEYYIGVEVPTLIDRQETTTAQDDDIDVEQRVTFSFLRTTLLDKDIYPEVGDIVEFDGGYYEINNVNENQLVAGQTIFNWSIKCGAHLTKTTIAQLFTNGAAERLR